MQEMNSQDTTKLAKALLNVQRQLLPAAKDATNPFTKSNTPPSTRSWPRAVKRSSKTEYGCASAQCPLTPPEPLA